jgi:hypothetical protein
MEKIDTNFLFVNLLRKICGILYCGHLQKLAINLVMTCRVTFLSLRFYGLVFLLYLNFRLFKKAASAGAESRHLT